MDENAHVRVDAILTIIEPVHFDGEMEATMTDNIKDPTQDAVDQINQRGLETTVDLEEEQARERHEPVAAEAEPEPFTGDVVDAAEGKHTNSEVDPASGT